MHWDRLWTGYLSGAAAAMVVALSCEAGGYPLWYGFAIFICLTPAGIMLANWKPGEKGN